MIPTYLEDPRKVMKNKASLEKSLNVKISIKDNVLSIEAKPEDEYLALEVIEALNLGFKLNDALLLKEAEFSFKKLNIKDESSKNIAKNIKRVRGRIIGAGGKALGTVESLTGCIISAHDNDIGIIGHNGDVEKAVIAVKKLIVGSSHANVYAYLEKQRAEERFSF